MSLDLWCVAAAAGAGLLGYALGWLGGHAVGLYKGEQGRRQAAESYLILGAPQAQPARRVMSKAAAPLEPKVAPPGIEDATVAQGAKAIQEAARQQGAPIPDDAQAKVIAHEMLVAAYYGGGEQDDIAL